jgi:outer membrane protein assembly factor BamB
VSIRPGGQGDITESHVSWELHRGIPEIPSPVYYQHRVYMVRDGGLVSCVNAGTGDLLYQERLGAVGQYSASPVIACDHIYILSTQGVVTVVKTGDTFQIAHQADLSAPVFATPALDENSLYIRTGNSLMTFR